MSVLVVFLLGHYLRVQHDAYSKIGKMHPALLKNYEMNPQLYLEHSIKKFPHTTGFLNQWSESFQKL